MGHLLFYDWVYVALASPGTCCIDQASLQLTNTHLPLPIALTPPLAALKLKTYATTPWQLPLLKKQ